MIVLISSLLDSMKNKPEQSPDLLKLYFKSVYLSHDLKYIAKPKAILPILRETDLLEKLLGVMRSYYFSDLHQQSTSMDLHE